jgi:hypothetical protein
MERSADTNGHIKELSKQEGWELFDRASQYYLEIPGEKFLENLDAGEYEDPDVEPGAAEVLMLLPFARV